ncbi:SpoIID/LytB domain-containing protein [Aeromicrobium sp. CFBP 8757]|uniref:SpoIID/LytB domain-containing protein n=1 Tax=Aeromicrobium sp. CFBP 8757 TaxID=2775288 RepID=UPI001786A6C0|nr:SpoIID/LytB domain-containing protein [Aeromicrobium sp. CFBP 8757]MBD8605246.1 SpoIID/LytB domain-containing protein [Aeromicrobium sp. CFBP 8757]
MLSWSAARRLSGLSIALVVTAGMLAPSSAQAAGTEVTGDAPGAVAPPASSPTATDAPAPVVDVTSTAVPQAEPAETTQPDPAAPSTSRVVAELPKTTTSDFRMVGVTWTSGPATGVTVEVRTRTSGTWSAWTTLDPEVQEGEGGQPGTEPLWVGDADGVAARVTSQAGAVQGVHIATIDPGADDATQAGAAAEAETGTGAEVTGASYRTAAATSVAATSDGAPAYTGQPTIITRAQWGASAGTPCDTPAAGDRTRGVVVHHTAGSNSYTKAQSASIVRATQAYHVKSRKWCDLGYNFLVDKYGQIFEGRRGGIDRAVRAAHSGNAAVNTYTMGVSMMGNYDLVKPTAALKDAMVKLIGWRMGTNYLKAKGTYSLGGKTLNMIAGHRDVLQTACPGRYGYAWLSESGGLRDRVEAYLAGYTSTVKSRYTALGATAAGPIFIGEAQTSTGSRLRAKNLDIYAKGAGGTGRAFTVAGAARTEYDRVGSRTGALGYPTGDAVAVSGGTRQPFEGGYVMTVAATGRATAYTHSGAVITGGGPATPAPAPATTKPGTVKSITVKAGRKSARLRWTAVARATSYDVCLVATKTTKTCDRSMTGVTSPTALMSRLKPTRDTDWYAKVRGVNGGLKGSYSKLKGFNLSGGVSPASISTTSTSSGTPVLNAASMSRSSTSSGSANTVTVPASGRITLSGHGFGHGIGMSQYGAQGAARQGVTYDRILATYYPGTALGARGGSIRVLISQDTSDAVDVRAASGLRFRKLASSFKRSLPTSVGGRKVTTWRIVRVSSRKTQSTLQYRVSGSSTFRTYKGIRWTGDGQFEGPARIALVLPGGTVTSYRGAIRSAVPAKGSTARDTVNVLPLEHYVRGVIAAEMPAGWAAEALKAQAVAARTYGVRSLAPSRYYDICSTTACQVYGGASRETASTDAAARATSGQYVSYQGAPALTQFSSSSGGRTSVGSQPYLVAGDDPYDGWSGNANHDWTTTVSASTIQKAYPRIGTLRSLTVTKRSGGGSWGGRVSAVTLAGTAGSVSISGNDARWAFGLKSNWFSFSS